MTVKSDRGLSIPVGQAHSAFCTILHHFHHFKIFLQAPLVFSHILKYFKDLSRILRYFKPFFNILKYFHTFSNSFILFFNSSITSPCFRNSAPNLFLSSLNSLHSLLLASHSFHKSSTGLPLTLTFIPNTRPKPPYNLLISRKTSL